MGIDLLELMGVDYGPPGLFSSVKVDQKKWEELVRQNG
jgi:hypothetical protein